MTPIRTASQACTRASCPAVRRSSGLRPNENGACRYPHVSSCLISPARSSRQQSASWVPAFSGGSGAGTSHGLARRRHRGPPAVWYAMIPPHSHVPGVMTPRRCAAPGHRQRDRGSVHTAVAYGGTLRGRQPTAAKPALRAHRPAATKRSHHAGICIRSPGINLGPPPTGACGLRRPTDQPTGYPHGFGDPFGETYKVRRRIRRRRRRE
jgi:hypothetical protein